MDLGQYASYPLPAVIARAFGVKTAQEIADHLGVDGTLTPDLARRAEAAYNSYLRGDGAPARALLTEVGLSETTVDRVLATLSDG